MPDVSLSLDQIEYPLTVVDGASLTLVLNGPQGPAGEAEPWLSDVFTAAPPEEGYSSVLPTSDWWDRIVECDYDVSLPFDASEYTGKRFILRTTAEIGITFAYSNDEVLTTIPAPIDAFGSTLTLIQSIGGVWMATINYTGVGVTIDTTITDGSTNAVSGNAVFDALALKAPSLKYLHGNRAITDALKTTLDAGLDAAIGIITDSTGNAVDEWVYLTVADIAARHPTHRVSYRLWNDTTKGYDLTTIQNGVGGDRHINYPTGSTFGYYQPITNLLDNWTGSDIEVQAEVSITAGGFPTTSCVLLSWSNADGTGRGWFQLGSTGFLQLNWSEDGSGAALKSVASSVAMASLTAGVKYAFKATLDIDDGAGNNVVKFWYSTNSGTTWTQLGTTRTTATATTVYTPTSTGSILQNSRGSTPSAGLKFYRVQFYKGINGQPLLPERIDLWQRNASGGGNTASLSGAPCLYVDNIAISGFGLNSHLTLQTAPEAAYIERGRLFWALASSHNDQGMSFGEWGRKADELMAIVRTKSVDDAPVILITQNSQSASAVFSESHNSRCVQQLRVGSARGWPVIDANGAWRDYGDYSALMNADGIHPLAGGSALTKNAILGALGY